MDTTTIEKPQQAAEPQTEKPLEQFGELMKEVADLPEDKIEKITIYTHGFIAGASCK